MLAEFGETEDAEVLHASFDSATSRCSVITRQALHILELASSDSVRCLHSIQSQELVSSSCLVPGRSLVAFVTGSRRRCEIFNLASFESVHTLSESKDILNVLCTDSYLALVMHRCIHVVAFSFELLGAKLHFSVSSVVRVETSENDAVACAVGSGSKVEVVAFPAPGEGRVGVLRLPRRNKLDSLLNLQSEVIAGSPSAGTAAVEEDEGVVTYSISMLEKDGDTPSLYPSLPSSLIGDQVPIPSEEEALESLHQFDAHVGSLQAMAVASDGRLLATMSKQGTILRIWDLVSPTCDQIKEVRRGSFPARVYSIAFSHPHGNEVACYGSSGTLHVFSAERSQGSRLFTERALSTFSLSKGRRGAVHFVQGKRRMVVALLWPGTMDSVDFFHPSGSPTHEVVMLTPSAALEVERAQQPGVLSQAATWAWERLKNDVFTEENIALAAQLAHEHFLRKMDLKAEGLSEWRSEEMAESFPPVVKRAPAPSAPDLPEEGIDVNPDQIQDENDRMMCPICCTGEKDTIFEPCRHCCCSECARKFQDKPCPFCRRNVESTKRVFL